MISILYIIKGLNTKTPIICPGIPSRKAEEVIRKYRMKMTYHSVIAYVRPEIEHEPIDFSKWTPNETIQEQKIDINFQRHL